MSDRPENCISDNPEDVCELNQHGERQFCAACYDTLFPNCTCDTWGENGACADCEERASHERPA